MRIIAIVAASLALASSALAEVTVIDGDTINLDGIVYRLHGIDAPEHGQTCLDGWPAGVMAFAVMSELLRGRTVACKPETTDRHGLVVAVCRADGLDLGAMMVRAGWAWAFMRYSNDYFPHEAQARADRAGVHGHICQTPWDWRALQTRQQMQHSRIRR